MKSESQILRKLGQLSFRHMKREITRLMATKPSNCLNNITTQSHGTAMLGICKLDCQTCDSVVKDRTDCGKFEPRHNVLDLKESWKKFIQEASVDDLTARYPDLAFLKWALGDSSDQLIPEVIEETVFDVRVQVPSEEDAQKLKHALSMMGLQVFTTSEHLADLRKELVGLQLELKAERARNSVGQVQDLPVLDLRPVNSTPWWWPWKT